MPVGPSAQLMDKLIDSAGAEAGPRAAIASRRNRLKAGLLRIFAILPLRNRPAVQKSAVIGFFAFFNRPEVIRAGRFGNVRSPYFIAFWTAGRLEIP